MEEKEITKIEKFKKISTLSNEEYQLFRMLLNVYHLILRPNI